MRFDDQWININPENDNYGERLAPQFARMVRTEGGMVIGRIVKSDGEALILQLYRHGEFVEQGRYDSFARVCNYLLREVSA